MDGWKEGRSARIHLEERFAGLFKVEPENAFGRGELLDDGLVGYPRDGGVSKLVRERHEVLLLPHPEVLALRTLEDPSHVRG